MDVLNYCAKSLSRVTIPLGRQLDHDVLAITVDVGEWLTEYPDGVIAGYATLPGNDKSYPLSIEMDGDNAVWTVREGDTAKAGYGKFQVALIGADGKKKHSAIADTIILASLSAKAGETPPDPYKPWMDQVAQDVSGGVRFDKPQALTDEQKKQARDNIGVGAGTGGVSEESVFDLLNKWGVFQSLQDSDGAYITDDDGAVLTYERDISEEIFAVLQRFGLIHSIVDGDGSNVADYDNAVLIYDK